MARARKASVTQSKLGVLLYGDQFTGKSTQAMSLAYFKRPDGKPFRVLYLDPESGSIDDYLGELEENGVNLNNIYIVYTQSLKEVREYIAKVKNNEDFYELDEDGEETDDIVLDADGEPFRADAIVIDGSSTLNLSTKQGLIEFSKKRNKVKADQSGLTGDERLVKIEGSGLELKDYNTINFRGQDLILDLTGCGVHYVVTARETDEKQTVRGTDGTFNSVSTGKKIPEGFKQMGYNAKTVIHMFRDENDQVCCKVEKDRTHTHDDGVIIEDPTLLDWQRVIDKNADKKEFIIKNDLSSSVEAERKSYEKDIAKNYDSDSTSLSATIEPKENINKLINDAMNLRKSLTPQKKSEAKTKLTEAGLPISFKDIKDVEVVKEVINLLKNI